MHELLNQLVPASIMGLGGFAVWFLKALGVSVRELNEKMAIYIEKVTKIVEHLEDHEQRIRQLENDTRSLN